MGSHRRVRVGQTVRDRVAWMVGCQIGPSRAGRLHGSPAGNLSKLPRPGPASRPPDRLNRPSAIGIHTTSGKWPSTASRKRPPGSEPHRSAGPSSATNRPVTPTTNSQVVSAVEQASTPGPRVQPPARPSSRGPASCGKGPLASACSAPGGSDPNAPGGRTWHRSRNAIPPIGSQPSAGSANSGPTSDPRRFSACRQGPAKRERDCVRR